MPRRSNKLLVRERARRLRGSNELLAHERERHGVRTKEYSEGEREGVAGKNTLIPD